MRKVPGTLEKREMKREMKITNKSAMCQARIILIKMINLIRNIIILRIFSPDLAKLGSVYPALRVKARGFGERYPNTTLYPCSKERCFTGGGVYYWTWARAFSKVALNKYPANQFSRDFYFYYQRKFKKPYSNELFRRIG